MFRERGREKVTSPASPETPIADCGCERKSEHDRKSELDRERPCRPIGRCVERIEQRETLRDLAEIPGAEHLARTALQQDCHSPMARFKSSISAFNAAT